MASKRGARGKAARRSKEPKAEPARKVGYAVVGLGHIAQVAILPGFAHAKENSRLVAVVSGDEEKREQLAKRYKVRGYSYEQLEECLASDDVDAVYVALPNDQHLEFVERAARAGVHVLCEKPLGLSTEECEQMIRTCQENNVKLMTAYRLHFEPANLSTVELIRSGKLGEPKFFSSDFSFQVKEGNIRAQRERGGGPIWDIGIYCINAARYLFRSEPVEVFGIAAPGKEPRFEEIDEGLSVVMRFPEERLATFNCHFGAAPTGSYRVVCTQGDVRLDGAYEYVGARTQTVTLEEKSRRKSFKQLDQFAPELLELSWAILEEREVEPSGWEGLADVRVIEAINESVLTGEPVQLAPFDRRHRPSGDQAHQHPPVKKPELINVEAGHQ